MNTNPTRWPILMLVLLLACPNGARSQTTAPAGALDGAELRLRVGETDQRYRLARINDEPDAPPSTAPARTDEPADPTFRILTEPRAAPCAVHVDATNLPLPDGTPLTTRYEWDFGDPTGRYNRLDGFNAAHIYDAPGEYTITLRRTFASGKTSASTMTITVAPDRRRDVHVSNDGDDTRDGATPESALRTLEAAGKRLGDDTRLLLRRGDSFDLTNSFLIPWRGVVLSAYGQGDRPRLVQTGKRAGITILTDDARTTRDLIIERIAFDSIHTEDTEQTGMPTALRPRGTNIAVRDCEFLNVGSAVNCNLSPRGLLVMDSIAPLETGVRGYFVWGDGSDLVIVGNRVVNSTRESCIRVNGVDARRVLISHNDLANPGRTDIDPRDTQKASIVLQRGEFGYVAHNRVRSGSVAVGPLANREGQEARNARWTWSVFESNGIEGIGVNIEHGAEHVLLRDNLISRNTGSAISIRDHDPKLDRAVRDLWIVGNTILNNSDKGRCINLEGAAERITLRNNIYIAPHLKPGASQTAAVYVAASDLGSFSEISNNTWPAPSSFHNFAERGVMYVWPSWSDKRGYLTPEEWNAFNVVQGDRFENLPLPGQ